MAELTEVDLEALVRRARAGDHQQHGRRSRPRASEVVAQMEARRLDRPA
jgi:hypothetical protein